MKFLILNNWYKIAIAFSSIAFSSAFLIYSLKYNVVQASPHFKKETIDDQETNYTHVVALPDGNIYGVRYDAHSYPYWKAELLTQVEVSRSR